jgi:hypothetical protein
VCRPCKEYVVDVDNGVALWQALHDARENDEEEKKKGKPRPEKLTCSRASGRLPLATDDC